MQDPRLKKASKLARQRRKVIRDLIEAVKDIPETLRQIQVEHNKHIMRADPQSQFYGEDIQSGIQARKIEAAIIAAQKVL